MTFRSLPCALTHVLLTWWENKWKQNSSKGKLSEWAWCNQRSSLNLGWETQTEIGHMKRIQNNGASPLLALNGGSLLGAESVTLLTVNKKPQSNNLQELNSVDNPQSLEKDPELQIRAQHSLHFDFGLVRHWAESPDFCPRELSANKWTLFSASKFVINCYSVMEN